MIDELDQNPPAELKHAGSYYLESCKAALREAAGRGIELPDTMGELVKLLAQQLAVAFREDGQCIDTLPKLLQLAMWRRPKRLLQREPTLLP